MQQKSRSFFLSTPFLYTVAIALGVFSGFLNSELLFSISSYLSEMFMNLLKLVSLPILFLSIVTVSSGMQNIQEMAKMGKKVVKYTLLTTIIAAASALVLYLIIDPAQATSISQGEIQPPNIESVSYWRHLLSIVPANIIEPFYTNNVMGVLLLALFISLGMFGVSTEQRKTLHSVFSSFYSVFMKITSFVIKLIPIALWAFITLFVRDVSLGLELKTIGLYLVTVLAANLFQGLVVLPIFLKFSGVSPRKLFSAMMPALTVAFFTKSSSATVPSAVRCAEERAGMNPKVSSFAFPLCTSINMNGCAAFILITVLFVSQLNGMVFSPVELVLWIFMATIAALGNASIPMGCFFLSSAFLATMNMPLNIMGVILPFYALVDAVETTLNVWSDSSVTAVVDKELKETERVPDSASLMTNKLNA